MSLKSLGLLTLSIVQTSKQLKNATFWKLDLLPSSPEGRETASLLLLFGRAVSKGTNRVGVSLPSPEDGNSQFLKHCFLVV
jgi:hypothetical protein